MVIERQYIWAVESWNAKSFFPECIVVVSYDKWTNEGINAHELLPAQQLFRVHWTHIKGEPTTPFPSLSTNLSLGEVERHGDLVSPESGEIVGVVELPLQVLQLLAGERGALLPRSLLQLLLLSVSAA